MLETLITTLSEMSNETKIIIGLIIGKFVFYIIYDIIKGVRRKRRTKKQKT